MDLGVEGVVTKVSGDEARNLGVNSGIDKLELKFVGAARLGADDDVGGCGGEEGGQGFWGEVAFVDRDIGVGQFGRVRMGDLMYSKFG